MSLPPVAWAGGPATTRATCVLAPNPGPMTLEGTNTWVLAEPGGTRALVVDPGPADENHLAAVLAHVVASGRRVGAVLLTHGHADHAAGAGRFVELAAGVGGAPPVRALDPAHRLGSEGLAGGDVVALDGLEAVVVATPGHTGDSLSFLLPAEGALLTGDTVLGRGSTVVAHPDGRLADYLASLEKLRAHVDRSPISMLLPGHGPVLTDPASALEACLAHRHLRLRQVEEAVAAGATTARAVVETVYAEVPAELWPAAELSVRAQLDYLSGRAG